MARSSSARSVENGSSRCASDEKDTTAISSAGDRFAASECAAPRISASSRKMLGLTSSTSAMLAGVAEASNEAISCAAPSSKRRKLSCVSPRTCVPSGAVTVQATCTRVTRERIAPFSAAAPGGSEGMQLAGNRIAFERRAAAQRLRTRKFLRFLPGKMTAPEAMRNLWQTQSERRSRRTGRMGSFATRR